MFALAWKEIREGGSQPIQMKSFRTEDARMDFIDTLRDNGTRFEVTSQSAAGDPTLEDFQPGLRASIHKALHPEYIGRTGTVVKTVKRSHMVLLNLDDGGTYYAWPWNLTRL